MNKYPIVGTVAAILVFATIAATTWPVQARKAGENPPRASEFTPSEICPVHPPQPCTPGHEVSPGPINRQQDGASDFAPGIVKRIPTGPGP
jgi:hypothetical protein